MVPIQINTVHVYLLIFYLIAIDIKQVEEDDYVGPNANVSLLDQHSELKKKAEGLGLNYLLKEHYVSWLFPFSF